MNVHVVCSDTSDRILPRLARVLADGNGWSLATTPHGKADVNVFIVYIDYAESHATFKATPVACWFTHYEKDHNLKKKWWDYAAKHINLRLTSAPMYAKMLARHGKTVTVRPPLDREAFDIGERTKNDKPMVGVSGFIPKKRTGQKGPSRKGEHLITRLYNSGIGAKVEMRASGAGWPVRKQSTRPVADLPQFYRGIDIYLCTSLVEGIPMPPLEALACGVPVIIPRGVGMMDELPEMRGIYKYRKGSFEGMHRALQIALDELGDVDREALRAVTEPYTARNWCGDFRRAIESLLYDVPLTVGGSGKRGVFYVAFGGPARKWVQHSMETFKEHMPGVEVAVVSNKPVGGEDVFIEHEDSDIGARGPKTKIYDLAPLDWEYVLYLDADTEIVADISFLYDLLADGWDMTICKNPGRFAVATNMVRPDNKDECRVTYDKISTQEVIQLNGGVFAFRRNARTAAFFRAWHKEWDRWGKRDQAALLRALWDHPLRLYMLGNEWNTVTRYCPKVQTAGILHFPMRARRWEGIFHGRLDGSEAWGKVKEWETKRKR